MSGQSKMIDTELVKNALGNAVANRGLQDGLVFHSDRGTQYSSRGYRHMLDEFGITPSMCIFISSQMLKSSVAKKLVFS